MQGVGPEGKDPCSSVPFGEVDVEGGWDAGIFPDFFAGFSGFSISDRRWDSETKNDQNR
jgi:hypothetical protein